MIRYKLLLVIGIIVTSITMSVTSVVAKSNKVTYFETEITDVEQLLELALSSEDNDKAIDSNIKIFKDGKEDIKSFKVKKASYTQKLKKTISDSRLEETMYATTQFTLIDDPGGGGLSDYDHVDTKYQWDGSFGVRAWATIYYNVVQYGSVDHYSIMKITGGWIVYDMLLQDEDFYITYGQSGFYGAYPITQVKSFSVTNDFLVMPPSNWLPVSSVVNHTVGINTYATISRGTGSTWELHMIHNI